MENGQEAFEAVKANQYDIVLMDVCVTHFRLENPESSTPAPLQQYKLTLVGGYIFLQVDACQGWARSDARYPNVGANSLGDSCAHHWRHRPCARRRPREMHEGWRTSLIPHVPSLYTLRGLFTCFFGFGGLVMQMSGVCTKPLLVPELLAAMSKVR